MAKKQEKRPEKREVFEALLKRGRVKVHFDPRAPEVVVPEIYGASPYLVFEYALEGLPIPIIDLVAAKHGISATLSFRRMPYFTCVPWKAVFAVTTDEGDGVVYEEDIPKEVLQAQRREAMQSVPFEGAPEASPPRPPSLRVIAGGKV